MGGEIDVLQWERAITVRIEVDLVGADDWVVKDIGQHAGRGEPSSRSTQRPVPSGFRYQFKAHGHLVPALRIECCVSMLQANGL